MKKKSYLLHFLLTVLFGPLGLLYSSVIAAVALVVVAWLSFETLGTMGPVMAWVVSIAIGFPAVLDYNERIDDEREEKQQLIDELNTFKSTRHPIK